MTAYAVPWVRETRTQHDSYGCDGPTEVRAADSAAGFQERAVGITGLGQRLAAAPPQRPVDPARVVFGGDRSLSSEQRPSDQVDRLTIVRPIWPDEFGPCA